MPRERIIITGITGFAGSHLADKVLEFWKNCDVYGFKREASNLENLKHLDGRIELIDAEMSNKKSLTELLSKIQPTKIFHLAATTPIPYSFEHPVEVFNFNALGTVNLLDAVREAEVNARFHLCSTSDVYGNVPLDEQPIMEETRINPHSPYAISKAAADFFGQCYQKSYDMDIVITRAFTYTGPRKREFFAESSFAKQIAMVEAGKKEPVINTGNLDTVRTFLDVRDLVEAYCALMDRQLKSNIYVVCGDATMSMRDALTKLIELSGIDVEIKTDPNLLRPIDIMVQKPDSSRIRKELGWMPKIPIEKSLKDLLDYWRESLI